MASEAQQTCYHGTYVDSFQFYLDRSQEHAAMLQTLHKVLPAEFQRIAAGKSSLDVLGVGSGGGEMDVQMVSLLPAVPITVDVVEGSIKLSDKFKALVADTASLQKVPFAWHVMHSGEYVKQRSAKGDTKKFDFIHMIQMIYYVEDLDETIKSFHSLLKNNGSLMIIVENAGSGWDTLWKTFKENLCVGPITQYRSSAEVLASVKKQGLKFEEHTIPNFFDITDCFDPNSASGQRLLSFMTGTDDFSQSFTPEIRAGMLELLKTKCSTNKDGKVMFNSTLSCIFISA